MTSGLYEDTMDDFPDPGAGWRILVYSEEDYQTLIAQPARWVEIGFTAEVNMEGGGEITLDADDAFWDVPLPESQTIDLVDQEAVWSLYYNGRRRFDMLAEDIYDDVVTDPDSGLRTVKITGRGVGCVLERWQILPDGMPTPRRTTRRFRDTGKVEAWIDMFEEAQANGVLTYVSRTFTKDNDSAGNPWDLTDKDFMWTAGTDLLVLLKRICQQENLRWSMHFSVEDGEFKLDLRPDEPVDRSDVVVFPLYRHQILHNRTRTRRKIVNHVTAYNGKHLVASDTDTDSVDKWRKRAVWIEAGSSVDEDGLNKIIAQTLRQHKAEDKTRVVKVSADSPGRALFRDYNVGDLVTVELRGIGNDDPQDRVIAATVKVTEDDMEVELALRQRRKTITERLHRAWFDGLQSFESNVEIRPMQAAEMLLQFVAHGSDPDVERPDTEHVFWIGSAVPNNRLDTDFVYPADI